MERLSNKDFIALGFKEFSYHTVGNSVSYNLGRRRYLSAVCIGQGNEALFLCEKSEVGNHYTDLVCIHNRDYDGFITLEKVKALIGWFGSGVAAVRDAQQAKIDELKAQLECCRKENAVLLGKVGELEKNEFLLARVKTILGCEKKTNLLESIIVRDLRKVLRGEHE